MAPEIIRNSNYNYKIDIWALGVLLFELFHQASPFKAENIELIQNKILYLEPQATKGSNEA